MFTLSIVFNVHREGEFARSTINNFYNVLAYTKKYSTWKDIEVIAVLDNADEVTRQVIIENKDLFRKIDHINLGDLALSRNHGVSLATNNFVLFSDGDDYISHEALISIYQKFASHYSQFSTELNNLPNKSHAAVFPSLLVEFPNLLFQSYTNSNDFIIDNMKFHHCFVSRICCPKILLLQNSLKKNHPPYGCEDWDLNNRLLALDVKFLIAPKYVLYHRRGRATSLMDHQSKNKYIVRSSALYQQNIQRRVLGKNIDPTKIPAFKWRKIKRNFFDFHHKIKCIRHFFAAKHRRFLLKYNEPDLSTVANAPFGSSKSLSTHFSPECVAYQHLLNFLLDKEIIFIVSDPSSTHFNLEKNLQQHDVSASKRNAIGIIYENTSEVKISQINMLTLTDISGFGLLHEDVKIHIILKALINAQNLEKIICINSELCHVMSQRYLPIFNEYQKEILITENTYIPIGNENAKRSLPPQTQNGE